MASRVLPLKSSVSFKHALSRGKKLRLSAWLTVYVLSDEKGESRFGLTISRKVAHSVIRNKLKRWVRASAQSTYWPTLFSGKIVVFVFRPQTDSQFYKKLQFKEFKERLAQVGST